MNYKNGTKKGFSLVELVIVVVILGIIAAIAVPRISSGSKNAGEAALRSNLSTLRTAIDRYNAEHHSAYPGARTAGAYGAADTEEALVSQLTMYSKADGTVSSDKDPTFPFGPYLRGNFPALTVGINAGLNSIDVVNNKSALPFLPPFTTGWRYNTATGQIIANNDEKDSNGSFYYKY